MADHPLPKPEAPPPGGYNDFKPPPARPVHDKTEYVRRVRAGVNRPGSAWRLCTITQPRSVHELNATVWPDATPVPKEIGVALFEAFADWVDAGKPAHR